MSELVVEMSGMLVPPCELRSELRSFWRWASSLRLPIRFVYRLGRFATRGIARYLRTQLASAAALHEVSGGTRLFAAGRLRVVSCTVEPTSAGL